MLTREAVDELLRDGALEITYAFDPLSTPVEPLEAGRQVDPDHATRMATRIYEEMFFGDRLGLTAGPLIRSNARARVRGRAAFGTWPGVFDLRKSGGKVTLAPGESITVNTIEQIKLDGSLGALILPRLTLTTAGVVVSPSYIDPYWDGIAMLQVHNVSRRPFDLAFGERIAQCRFYRLDGQPLAAEVREKFTAKSHHYGLTWSRIADGADPFPTRKRATRKEPWTDRALALTNRGWVRALGLAGVVSFVVGAIFVAGRYAAKLDHVDTIDAQVAHVQQAVRSALQVRAGETTVTFGAGASRASATVAVSATRASGVPIAQLVEPRPGWSVAAQFHAAPDGRGAVVKLLVKRPRSDGPAQVDVRWAVL